MVIYKNDSWLELCNTALARINVEQIQSFAEVSHTADLCKQMLEESVGEVMAVKPWRSACKRVRMTADAMRPIFDRAFKFSLPGDFINVVSVNAENEQWELVGNCIEADFEILELVYIGMPEQAEYMPPLLKAAVTAMLASKLAMALTSDFNMATVLQQEAIAKIELASRQEGKGYKDMMYKTRSWKEMI